MASVTLAESAKLAQDELVEGLIENIITVNQMFELLPFDGIDGNSLAYNRENALGSVGVGGVGSLLSTAVNPIDASTNAKNPATFTLVTSNLTTIFGDAEVNGLIQVTRSAKNDQTGIQVASKAKHCGRVYQQMLINGTGAANQFTGLLTLVPAAQKVVTGANGGALSFPFLDELLDLVIDKDGQVDYITMHSRTHRSYLALLRTLGGASINEVRTLPSGATVSAYRNVPIFRNDWIPINQVKGTGSNQTTIFAGTFDEGEREHGIAGLTARDMAGLVVEDVGIAEDKDERITRVKWYTGLALFSEKGIASADGITN